MDDLYRAERIRTLVQLRRQGLSEAVVRLGDRITKENAEYLMCRITEDSVNPYSPMKEFEEKTGLTGLSFDYKMPEGKDASTVEIDYEIIRLGSGILYDLDRSPNVFDFKPSVMPEQRQIYLCYVRDLISSLKDLNPELRGVALKQDNVDQSVDFILGVTSGYNPDDIAYYLSKKWDQTHWMKTPHIRALNDSLQDIFNDKDLLVGGIVSPQTTQKVDQQLAVLRVRASVPKPA